MTCDVEFLHPGQFTRGEKNDQERSEMLYDFPASRGLSRRDKMEREKRDVCRLPTSCLMKPLTKFLLETYRFSKPVSFNVKCARALLDCTLAIIEPTVDYGFHEIREFRNFSL